MHTVDRAITIKGRITVIIFQLRGDEGIDLQI